MIEVSQLLTKCTTNADSMLKNIISTTTQQATYYYSMVQKQSDLLRRYQWRILALKITSKQQKYLLYFDKFDQQNLPLWQDKIPRAKKELDFKLIEDINYSTAGNVIVFNFKKASNEKSWYIKFNGGYLRDKWKQILELKTEEVVQQQQKISRKYRYAIKEQDLYPNQQDQQELQKQKSQQQQESSYLKQVLSDSNITLEQKIFYIFPKLKRAAQLHDEVQILRSNQCLIQQECQRLEKQNSDVSIKLSKACQKQSLLSKEITALNKDVNQKQSEIQTLKGNIIELSQGCRQKANEIIKLEEQGLKIQRLYKMLNQQKKALEEEHASLNQKYQNLNAKYIKAESDFRSSHSSYEQISKLYKSQLNLRLFSGSILKGDSHNKEFLKSQIQAYVKSKVQSTRLVYKYDALNNVNFHKYLDYIDNLLLLVRLKNGAMIAAFTIEGFHPKKNTERGGLILSLTNKKSFELIKGHRSIQYDDYYIIFGNSEIRIKSQQSKIFSNFGINNAFYGSKGQKVDVLFCADGNREVDVADYQFYQIQFEL